ncbi:hypothetical protein [Streptomyces sp. NPDC014676]|uniref:hypothetical protein n=1 Tax=Streptomyces sp. NPDC014676 TaxID=3364879 RepID=UPI0036F59A23
MADASDAASGTGSASRDGEDDTLVNGRALPREEARRLRVGDMLTFAKGLRAHVAAARPE